jgi:2-keto-4-pentenoate hydratase
VTDVAAATAVLRAARESGTRLQAWPPGLEPATLEEGYAIQAALLAGLPAQTGWKLAAAGRAPQERLGIDRPIIGRLTADRELPDGGRLSMSRLWEPVAEPEIGFVMAGRIGPEGREPADSDILSAVGTVRLAIEVPDAWFRDRDALAAPSIIADNSWSGFYVLGPRVDDWRGRDLASAAVVVRRNGEEVATGSGALISKGPVACLLWLARELRSQGLAMEPGQAVITGTCTWPVAVAAGDVVVADFGPLGSLSLGFQP